MTEVIATIDPQMPSGYEKLDGIEVIKQTDGELRINGILRLGEGESQIVRKVLIPDPLELYTDTDSPDELIEDWHKRQQDPEKWEMQRSVAYLQEKVEEHSDKNAELETRVSELTAQKHDLEDRVRILEGLLYPNRVQKDTPTTEQNAEPAAGQSDPAGEAPASTEEGIKTATVLDTEADHNERAKTAVANSNPSTDHESIPPNEDAEISTAMVFESSEQKPGLWHRAKAGAYNLHSNMATSNLKKSYKYDDQNRVIEEVEEKEDKSGRKYGVGILVGALAVGAAWWIWGRHNGGHHDVTNNYYYNTTPPGSAVGSGANQASSNLSGIHSALYNPDAVHPKTVVELPKNLSLVGHPGRYDIVNNKGNVVIHSTQWDQQHNLSKATRQALRAKGYVLNQGFFGKYFKTVVSNG